MSKVVITCRACVYESSEYKSLHHVGVLMGESTTLASLLSLCTNLDFTAEQDEESLLPMHICALCVQTLAKWYAFKNMVLQNDEILRARMKHTNVELCDSIEDDGEGAVEYLYADEIDAEELQPHQEYLTLQEEFVLEDEKSSVEQLIEVERLKEDKEDEEHLELEQLECVEERLEEDLQEDFVLLHESDPIQSSVEENLLFEMVKVEEETENILLQGLEETVEITKMPNKKRKKTMRPANPPDPDAAAQCRICCKRLSSAQYLIEHMRLHSKETPFKCSACGERFKSATVYKRHKLKHDPNNPYKCKLCHKVFGSAAQVSLHMMSHTGDKPFKCEVCGVGMTQKSCLKKHMLLHTGEMPHVCDMCGKKFRYISNMKVHKLLHANDKTFECNTCEKRFHTERQLKRHVETHKAQYYRPHACDKCNRSFKHPKSLAMHRRNEHNEFVRGVNKSSPKVAEETLKTVLVEVI